MPRKDFETEDPMELVGMVMPGEEGTLEAMAECFIDEYVRLGRTAVDGAVYQPDVSGDSPGIRAKGEDYVRALIRKTLDKWHPHRETINNG